MSLDLFLSLDKEKYIKNYYDILYADPPWQYSNKSTRSSANDNYSTLSNEDIINLKIKDLYIKDIAKENSVLFLWTTGPFLNISIKVLEGWGFNYKTLGFVWVKQNKNGTLYTGMGNYTRANAEICLLGVKGKGLKVADHSIRNTQMSYRLSHSQKPQLFRNLIEKLYNDQENCFNKIEIFGRTIGRNWDGFGNEVEYESEKLF